jgi:hypothetical protein
VQNWGGEATGSKGFWDFTDALPILIVTVRMLIEVAYLGEISLILYVFGLLIFVLMRPS